MDTTSVSGPKSAPKREILPRSSLERQTPSKERTSPVPAMTIVRSQNGATARPSFETVGRSGGGGRRRRRRRRRRTSCRGPLPDCQATAARREKVSSAKQCTVGRLLWAVGTGMDERPAPPPLDGRAEARSRVFGARTSSERASSSSRSGTLRVPGSRFASAYFRRPALARGVVTNSGSIRGYIRFDQIYDPNPSLSL
jgi:hypothetical protein